MRQSLLNSLLWSAIGDAYGAPLEDVPRKYWRDNASEPVMSGFYGRGGWLGVTKGQVTDDTIIGLAITKSLIKNNGLNINDLINELLKIKNHWIGYGLTTTSALNNLSKGKHWSESGIESTGSGSLFYWPLSYFYTDKDLNNKTRIACSITHKGESLLTALTFNKCLDNLLSGQSKNEAVINAGIKPSINESMKGFTAKSTLMSAVTAFLNNNEPLNIIKHAAYLSRDSDTSAYIAGVMIGAHSNKTPPKELINKLHDKGKSIAKLIMSITHSIKTYDS